MINFEKQKHSRKLFVMAIFGIQRLGNLAEDFARGKSHCVYILHIRSLRNLDSQSIVLAFSMGTYRV